MADVPRDPRQLARDILAGKVRIEDLQRQRQARPAGPAQQMPARQPMPRPQTPPQQRPLQRGMPPVQPPRQAVPRRMPPPLAPPLNRAARPQLTVPPPAQPRTPVQSIASAPDAPDAAAAPTTAPAQAARRPLRLQQLVHSKHALRQGILLAEVLGKPVSLRLQ